MDIQCKGLEKDWSFMVGSDRIKVTERSGGMGTIWSPLGGGIRGVWDVVCASKKGELQILLINLLAPCDPCIGQAFRYSPETAFYIFNQQIHFII